MPDTHGYRFPAEEADGPPIADLEGRLLAIWPNDVAERDTKYGQKLVAIARVVEVDADGSTSELGTCRFAQVVLAGALAEAKSHRDWLVGRIVMGQQAWLIRRPEPGERDAVAKAMDVLTAQTRSSSIFDDE